VNTSSLLKGLRFVDSFFPSGGFAFSSGLEAAVSHGAVRDGKEFARYVEDLLIQGTAKREGVAVAVAHRSGTTGNVAPALAVDKALEALKMGRESRLASRQMGRQVMKAAIEQFPGDRALQDFGTAADGGLTPGHVSVTAGLTLAACGWSRQDSVAAFLYQTAQGMVSAAMKLLPVGQQQGQQLLVEWAPLIVELSRHVSPRSDLGSWSPIQDIYAMRHARLESRLFRS
jgi:urease accessory protein